MEERIKIFKAIADETRLKILILICKTSRRIYRYVKKNGNSCGGYLPYGYAYSLWTYF
jgi:DNA-binding transcriptional ArsR family regulator